MSQTPDVLWRSTAPDASELSIFMERLRGQGLDFSDYEALRQWSVENLDDFWLKVWHHFALPAATPPNRALVADQMPDAVWFPDLATNYAEAMLRLPGRADDDVVIISRSQSRADVRLTCTELRAAVAAAQRGLLNHGVARGDRVAAYAPNAWETLVLMLAAASIGAIFSSCAPEFGTRSVIDRLSQIEPKLLLAVDGYAYGMKRIDRREEVAEITAALPSVKTLVWLPYLNPRATPPENAILFADLCSETGELEFERVPFDHPLYVLFSSGTTGIPKAIVHCHGGMMLGHCASQGLQYNIGSTDTFYWFTTTGWMMWNYLVSGLMLGATVVLFDGDPAFPELDQTWSMVEELGITQLGTSAPYLLQCRKAGLVPQELYDLSTLRGIGSTGSPLPESAYRWVYEAVGTDLMLSSQSGGTDVCGGFVGGSPMSPVYAGEIACRMLGVAVDSFDAAGASARGFQGELVITKPMPSMPVGFWGDTDGSRYREAYFDKFPGVWHHGDWLTISERGTCVITGRSDATLNRGGVRLGTSEFYAVIEDHPSIVDSLVVHLEDPEGGAGTLWLFVVVAAGADQGEALRKDIARMLRAKLSPRHVPDEFVVVSKIPRTVSGKKLEIPIKRILQGAPVEDAVSRDALADPSALDEFISIVAHA